MVGKLKGASRRPVNDKEEEAVHCAGTDRVGPAADLHVVRRLPKHLVAAQGAFQPLSGRLFPRRSREETSHAESYRHARRWKHGYLAWRRGGARRDLQTVLERVWDNANLQKLEATLGHPDTEKSKARHTVRDPIELYIEVEGGR